MLVICILNAMNSILLWNKLSLVMKNGLLCCLFDGIGKMWYFLNCFQGTKRLIWMSAVVNWTSWTQRSNKNGLIGQSYRCNFSPWQRYTIYIFSHVFFFDDIITDYKTNSATFNTSHAKYENSRKIIFISFHFLRYPW